MMTKDPRYDTLKEWWIDNAVSQADAVVPKAVEYSSEDLAQIGYTMADMLGLEAASTEEANELGLLFYLHGKTARWIGAVKEGRRPSDDTIFDIVIYATMAQRNRAVGGWPFGPEED
jgi:hypothetical protein